MAYKVYCFTCFVIVIDLLIDTKTLNVSTTIVVSLCMRSWLLTHCLYAVAEQCNCI